MPVAVELNGLLPGLGPGRGAPGRDAPGRGAPGRGAPGPDAPGRAVAPPGDPGASGREAPGAGLDAEGRGWPVSRPPGPRKSAGVAGDRGGAGTPVAPAVLVSCGPGWDTGDGGTGGRRRAAPPADAPEPFAASGLAASGALARPAAPSAVPAAVSGATLGAGAVPGAARPAAGLRLSWPAPALPPARASAGDRPSAGFAAAGWADVGCADCWFCCAAWTANSSLSRRTTGASIVEDADRTNSPISLSRSITALLSTPNSFASS